VKAKVQGAGVSAEQQSFAELGYTGFPVRLAAFEGPLDLLVHLVRKKEVPLEEVPLAEICDQYVEYLKEAEEAQVEVTSAFLVMAATLLYLKSRLLLPQHKEGAVEEADDDYEETRRALLRQVAQYEQFSEVGKFLQARYEVFGRMYRRGAASEVEASEYDLSRLTVEELSERLPELLENARPREAKLPEEVISLTEAVAELRRKLAKVKAKTTFENLTGPQAGALELAAFFLGLVHLVFMQQARARQAAPFATIWVEPRKEGASGAG